MMNILSGLFVILQVLGIIALAIGIIVFGVWLAITSEPWFKRHELFFARYVTPAFMLFVLLVLAYALGSENGGQFKWVF